MQLYVIFHYVLSLSFKQLFWERTHHGIRSNQVWKVGNFLHFTKKRKIVTSAFGALQLIVSLYKNYDKYFLACLLHWNGWRMHQKVISLRNSIISTFHFVKPKIVINQLSTYIVIPLLISLSDQVQFTHAILFHFPFYIT